VAAVSREKQGRNALGMAAQQAAVVAFTQGANLIAEFTEVETGRNNDRPELHKAIAHAKAHKARLVIAKLDRLGRNAAFLLTLRDNKVDFVCADMPGANKLTIGIMAVIAEDEADRIAQRTKEALKAAKARGTKLGDHARIHAAKIKATKARYETVRPAIQTTAHLNATQAAITLNAKAVTTPSGATWRAEQIIRARRHLEIALTSAFPLQIP
jgi:DNA invertase Pin-like site-specific DNA recombinase